VVVFGALESGLLVATSFMLNLKNRTMFGIFGCRFKGSLNFSAKTENIANGVRMEFRGEVLPVDCSVRKAFDDEEQKYSEADVR